MHTPLYPGKQLEPWHEILQPEMKIFIDLNSWAEKAQWLMYLLSPVISNPESLQVVGKPDAYRKFYPLMSRLF